MEIMLVALKKQPINEIAINDEVLNSLGHRPPSSWEMSCRAGRV
jgi:4-hydroxy-3-methylbut-2-en-1-yl diphosphate synthase IspG/GcpE